MRLHVASPMTALCSSKWSIALGVLSLRRWQTRDRIRLWPAVIDTFRAVFDQGPSRHERIRYGETRGSRSSGWDRNTRSPSTPERLDDAGGFADRRP